MATTIRREGKEKRGSSVPATLGKDVAARGERSSSSRSKPNPSPRKNAPTEASGRLTRNKSMEGTLTAPQPPRSPTPDGAKKKASLPRRIEEVVAGTSRRPSPLPTGTKTKPRGSSAASRPKPGGTTPKPKPERAVKPQQKVPTPPARGRSPSRATPRKTSSSSSRSSPAPETVPEEEVVVPVAEMIPDEVVVVNADDEFDHQCLLDSTQLEDDQIPDLPDPEREKEPVDSAEEEPDIKTEIGVDVAVGHGEKLEQPAKEAEEEEKEAKGVVQKERTAVARTHVKETMAYNDVIEETRSRLADKKSKVLALVGAFETVISLQEPEPTPIPAQANQQVDEEDEATVAVAASSTDTTTAATPDGYEAERDNSADELTSPTLTTAAT